MPLGLSASWPGLGPWLCKWPPWARRVERVLCSVIGSCGRFDWQRGPLPTTITGGFKETLKKRVNGDRDPPNPHPEAPEPMAAKPKAVKSLGPKGMDPVSAVDCRYRARWVGTVGCGTVINVSS